MTTARSTLLRRAALAALALAGCVPIPPASLSPIAPAPAPPPPPPCDHPADVPVTERDYPVAGGTWSELHAARERDGPVGEDGAHWPAQTVHTTSLTCAGGTPIEVTVAASVEVVLPAWRPGPDAAVSPAEWADWRARLAAHEAAHVAIALPLLACLPDRLAAARTCEEAFATHAALTAEVAAAQRALDARTDHGLR